MAETIFQHPILIQFVYPFFFMFLVVYAVLEKTKVLGSNKQINSLVALVIGLIFVTAIFPKVVVGNLILFLTIAITIALVTLLLWGFVAGMPLGEKMFEGKWKWVVLAVVIIAVFFAVLWAADIQGTFFDLLFRQSWSEKLWTNLAFIVVIAIALAVAMKGAGKGG